MRVVLAALGIGVMLWGGWLLVSTQRPDQLLNLAVWLAAAVIAHDFVLVPAITVLRRRIAAMRRGRVSPPPAG
ncbi:hypothetical protein M2317_001548 [Microbacterium sp. ZKA21]|uniref:hypothetical protein n=1 Tax=Microbacterium sp. ZKA21 TaxID=3381694 RepID=UPI003D236DF3